MSIGWDYIRERACVCIGIANGVSLHTGGLGRAALKVGRYTIVLWQASGGPFLRYIVDSV